MCTRSYPECSVYGEGADGECDMDSSTENANSSDSLNSTRPERSVTAIPGSWPYCVRGYMMRIVCICIIFFMWKEIKITTIRGNFTFFWVYYYLSPIINWPTCTSFHPILVTWLAPRLHLWFLGRSSLRTMVRGRMWILLQAVLALKMTPEQMASQIWDPPFLPGWWLCFPFLADILNSSLKEKSCVTTIQCYIFKFEYAILCGVVMPFPHVVVLKGNGRAAHSSKPKPNVDLVRKILENKDIKTLCHDEVSQVPACTFGSLNLVVQTPKSRRAQYAQIVFFLMEDNLMWEIQEKITTWKMAEFSFKILVLFILTNCFTATAWIEQAMVNVITVTW